MSTRAYRVLHYVPDPASGARFPVAALSNMDGQVRVVLAPHVPGDECLGGPGRARFIHRLHQRLLKVDVFERLSGLGPYCELSDPIQLQEGVDHEFVEKLVSDWHSPTSRGPTEGVHVSRRAEGHNWLQTHHVDRYVRPNFRPGGDYGGFLKHAPALEAVSHYVPGTEALILLEPITLRPKVEEDIRKVARRFGSYAQALSGLEDNEEGLEVEMCAYALPGVPKKIVDLAVRDIQYSSARVFSVADSLQKLELLDKIRTVAAQTVLIH